MEYSNSGRRSSLRQAAAELLGTYATPSREVSRLLLTRFRDDDDNDVRSESAKALVSLAHRSPPDLAHVIERRLCDTLEDDAFRVVNRSARTNRPRSNIFDALVMFFGAPTE